MMMLNTLPAHRTALDDAHGRLLDVAAAQAAARLMAQAGPNPATPLHTLPVLAGELGLASIHIKDEGRRLGLGSFKALGGAYAVIRLALDLAGAELGRPAVFADLQAPAIRALMAHTTFCCATDGNHGRSVAQGARSVGAQAVVFVHAGVSDKRIAAIAAFGARMIRVERSYDDSVAEAARMADEQGWSVVSDTSWPGYEHIPGLVMQGYTIIVQEALAALAAPPTHVFVQAGVGGLAAAVAGHLALVFGDRRPRIIVVEPDRAACLYESARAGQAVQIPHGPATVMAMLECYAPSLIAWHILAKTADAFLTVAEEDAVEAMNLLAKPKPGDPAIVAGESGCVGLAGLLKTARDAAARGALGLDAGSRILLINTEGATDPQIYQALVGLDPAALAGTAP